MQSELGRRVARWSELGTGTNNRLFRLDVAEGPPLLAKLYARDRWDRLGTEYPALALLAERGFPGVPRPYLRDDEQLYGVYSFEPGQPKGPAELDEDDAHAAAAWAAALHRIGPDDVGDTLRPASPSCFSIGDQIALIEWRLTSYETALADPARDPAVQAFGEEIDLRAAVGRLLARASDGSSDKQVARHMPRSVWRLNTADFGVHNMLFGADGLRVVDFEGAGWDDPARMVMGFVVHGGSEDLSSEAAAAFLGGYAEARGLDADEIDRYERVGALCDAEWVAIYASAVAPEAMAPKRFGTPDFDPAAHVARCLGKARERLARAARSDGYRFPRRR